MSKHYWQTATKTCSAHPTHRRDHSSINSRLEHKIHRRSYITRFQLELKFSVSNFTALTKWQWIPTPNYILHPAQQKMDQKHDRFPSTWTTETQVLHTEGFWRSMSKLLMAQGSAKSSVGSSPTQHNMSIEISASLSSKISSGMSISYHQSVSKWRGFRA